MKNHLNAILIIFLCLFGCNGKTEKRSTAQSKNMEIVNNDSIRIESNYRVEKDSESSDSKFVKTTSWMDDFRNFRMAIYNNDVPKLETYFNFPFDDEGHTILGLCNISDNDWVERKKQFNNPDLFYRSDLAKYYKNIFDENFTTLLLKVNCDQLFGKQHLQTKIIEDEDGAYQLFVDYSEVENT